MGIETIIGLGSAAIGAASAHHVQAANAAAQSKLNRRTMNFNREEAKKARDFQAAQSAIDRQFNSSQAVAQRKFAAQQVLQAQQFNAQESLLGRQFEERMSSTAHQREVQDLYKAGLNPILSATGGSGASTPAAPVIGSPAPAAGVAASHSGGSGAAASIGALNAYMKKDVLGQFVNSALEGLRVRNDYIKAQAQDKEAEAAKRNVEINERRQKADESKIKSEILRINSDIKIAFEDLDIRKDIRDATIEEKKANVNRLISAANLSDEQASKVGLEKIELERRMRYGTFLMSYLPSDARDYIASHMIDFVKENEPLLKDYLNKAAGDIIDFKPSQNDVNDWSKAIKAWIHKRVGGEDPLNTFGDGRVNGSH